MILNHILAQIITPHLMKHNLYRFYNKHLLHELQHRTKATHHTIVPKFTNHLFTFWHEWTVHIKPYPGLYVSRVVYMIATHPINHLQYMYPIKEFTFFFRSHNITTIFVTSECGDIMHPKNIIGSSNDFVSVNICIKLLQC